MKLALDWDDEQIRLVAADRTARGLRIRAAAVVSIGEDGLQATLAELSRRYSLEKSDVLVAVGRDRAEVRQMQLPPVPTEELPDMVRFQAIRQFASAGDSAEVDFITTHADESAVHVIVAATGPAQLTPIRKAVEQAGWTLERVGLRPIAAAALYRLHAADALKIESKQSDVAEPIIALIDLVANEAEIVLLSDGVITFVRSVRLPDGDAAKAKSRAASLAGEIRRSMIASGAVGSACHVVMWGSEKRHSEELKLLSEHLSSRQETPCQSRLIDPLELVGADAKVREATGDMVGRLAPLVGLLVADAGHPDELIDFLNPRKTIEKKADRGKIALMVGAPLAVVLVLGWLLWGNIARLNTQIDRQTAINNDLRTKTEASDQLIEQTEQIDQFLDGDVNWLDELEHLASVMPPSDELIVKDILVASNPRGGGGRLVVSGLVTSPEVIKDFETSMRDPSHQVSGDKVTQLASNDAYRWQMVETIRLAPEAVREKRYARLQAIGEPSTEPETSPDPVLSPEANADDETGSSREATSDGVPAPGAEPLRESDNDSETESEPPSSSDQPTAGDASPPSDDLSASDNLSASDDASASDAPLDSDMPLESPMEVETAK